MAQKPEEDKTYHPKDAIQDSVRLGALFGGGGLLFSAIQVALTRQNVGAMAVFTKTGGTITVMAAAGVAYGFTKSAAANLREEDDHYNTAIGGFFGGAVPGLAMRSFPAIIGIGVGAAVVQGGLSYSGGTFGGTKQPDPEAVGGKEWYKKNRRRPIQETIDDIGEGRGIYGPGYRERRADRIKERYGIDVPRT